MLTKLEDVDRRYHELEAMLSDPAVQGNRKEFVRISREHAAMVEVVARYRDWKKLDAEEAELAALLDDADPEMREMANAELPSVRTRKAELEEVLKLR